MAQTEKQDKVRIILAKKRLKDRGPVLYLVKWTGDKPDSWELFHFLKACKSGQVQLNKFYLWAKQTGVDISKSIARQEALKSPELKDNGNYRITFVDKRGNKTSGSDLEMGRNLKKKPNEANKPKGNGNAAGTKKGTQAKTGVTSKAKNIKTINNAKAKKVRSKAQKVLQKKPEIEKPAKGNNKGNNLVDQSKNQGNQKSSPKSRNIKSNIATQSKEAVKVKSVGRKQGVQTSGKQVIKTSEKGKGSPNKNDKTKGGRRLEELACMEGATNSGSESDTLYSLAGASSPKKLKLELVDIRHSPSSSLSNSRSTTPQPDSEVSFKITSPVRKILLKDSVKKKNKLRNKPAEAETRSGISPALPLPATPSSLFGSAYKQDKTPPGTPTRLSSEATPTKPGDLYTGFPRMLNVPVIPNSPAASYKTLMKTLQNLQADRGMKRKHGDNEEPIERRSSVRQSESIYKYKEIAVKKASGYTQIWLMTQTKMKNALNPQVFSELSQALHNAKFDDSKVVMLGGYGSTFCSGIDLHYLTKGDCRSNAKKMADSLKEFVKTMISFPKPVVAAVNGSAVGLGTSILPLCDIVYASDKATFSCPYSRLGQTPEACGSFTLPQVLGMAMANEMLLGGRRLTAQEACQAGLVSQVFWPTSLMQEVIPRVQQMANTSAKALETSKLLIRSHQKTKLEFSCDSECSLLSERWSSADCLKAMRTYLDREDSCL